jgi:hypothetical protein
MERYTTPGTAVIRILVIRQIRTGSTRRQRASLTPDQLASLQTRINKPENGYILLEIQEEI